MALLHSMLLAFNSRKKNEKNISHIEPPLPLRRKRKMRMKGKMKKKNKMATTMKMKSHPGLPSIGHIYSRYVRKRARCGKI